MCSKRDVVIFFAGVSAFHTISHILIGYLGVLPLTFLSIHWTVQLNMIAIAVNAVITVALLWWASKIK